MGRKKLHERFLKADAESPCMKCEKVRKICRDCECCVECCQCEYCGLCGLPNGYLSECTCFQCEACHQTFPEDENVLDDGNYDRDYIMPGEEKMPMQQVCTKCYEARKRKGKR